MLTKRGFDAVLIIVLLSHPAIGLARMMARRWTQQESGLREVAGSAILQATA